MKLDILAFGAHPDDIELGCGGTLIVEKNNNKKIGLIDLTQGELGTRGSAPLRLQEAEKAKQIIGATIRENLKMEDGFFEHNQKNLIKIITCIRHYQPSIVFTNPPDDRHPDHGKASKLVTDAFFLAGLPKIETVFNNHPQTAWRPNFLFYYILSRLLTPTFYIDISTTWERKIQSVLAYSSQFYVPEAYSSNENETVISSKSFLKSWEARFQVWGKNIGTQYAEGFISVRNIGMQNLDFLIHSPY